VAWPADSGEPIVMLAELASLLRRRGVRPIAEGRLRALLYGYRGEPAVNELWGWEIRSLAESLGVDIVLFHYDTPPPRGQKPRSLLDELR